MNSLKDEEGENMGRSKDENLGVGGGGGHFACGIREAAQLLEPASCPDPATCSEVYSVPPFSYL